MLLWLKQIAYLAADYDWLQTASDTDTGAKSGIWNILFNKGVVAGIYRLFLIIGATALVIYLILACIKAMAYFGDSGEQQALKSYLGRWVVCVILFSAAASIIGLCLKIGGAL